jgi:hypothetical protein
MACSQAQVYLGNWKIINDLAFKKLMFVIITGSGSKHAEDMMTELQGSIQKSLPHQHTMVDSKFATESFIIDQS